MKKLFFSLLMMLASVSTWATSDWAAGDNVNYYLYNVESGMFLKAGNDWGTRACLGDEGQTFKITAEGDLVRLKSTAKGNGLFFNNGHEVYTDMGTQNHDYKWDITKNADGTCYIRVEAVSTLFGSSTAYQQAYLAYEMGYVAGSAGGYNLHPAGASRVNKEAVLWMILTQAEYDGIKATVNAARDARKAAWPYVRAAKNSNLSDLTNLNTIYNTASTADQVTAAAAALKAQLEGAEATATSPVDYTFKLVNPDSNDGKNGWTMEAGNTNWNGRGGSDTNNNAESWQSVFDMHQTITEIPNGVYELTAQAALTDYTNNYDGANYPVVYAGLETAPFCEMTTADRGTNMTQLGNSFSAGLYTVGPIKVNVVDGTLKIGIKGTRTNTWCIWDNFEIKYLGVDLSALKDNLATLITTAEAVTGKMNAEVASALATALEGGRNCAETQAALEAAIAALNTAITNAQNSIAIYEKIVAIKDKISTLTESGKTACVVATKYEAGEYETLAEAEEDFRTAVLAQTEDGADFTGAIVNPDFSTGNINGWTDTFTAGNHGYQANNHYDNTDDGEDAHCNQFMECWVPQPGSLANGKLSQVLKNLPAGNYTLTADVNSCQQSGQIAIDNLTGVYIFATCAAGTFRSEACATNNGKPKTFSFTFNTTAGDCELGLMTENTNCNWVAFDNCRLVRNGASTVNVYQEALKELVAGAPANIDDVEAAADTKTAYVAAYNAAATTSETNGLTDDEYLQAGNALSEAKAALDASAASYAVSKPLRDAITAGTNVWTPEDDFAGWTLDHADGNFHKNTWSGEADGTGMVTPFGEYWCPKENISLANGVISYTTLVGLPAGNYAVSVLVRAYNENGGEISGLKFNDIEVTTETATYVKYNALEGVYGVITDVITVGEDGNLDFGFTVDGATFNWLAWKGLTIKYLSNETSDAAATLKISDAGYATFCAPYTVQVPADVTAYTVSAKEGTTLTLTEVEGVIPANTPVVLEGEATTVNTTGVDYATIRNLTKGMLTGVLEKSAAPVGSYILQNNAAGVGFYKVAAEGLTVGANRAYLTAPASEVKAFFFDQETAIKAIDALTSGKAEIYDLNGRKLNKMQKGINIVNGVKVLVK